LTPHSELATRKYSTQLEPRERRELAQGQVQIILSPERKQNHTLTQAKSVNGLNISIHIGNTDISKIHTVSTEISKIHTVSTEISKIHTVSTEVSK
jgi:hypothetical protein